MSFSEKIKKRTVIVLLLLVILTVMPMLSVQASVGLSYFRAVAGPDFIRLEWETGQEIDNLGFNLYRGLSDDFNQAQKLNNNLIPGTGSATGSFYDWLDDDVEIGVDYTYWIEDIDIDGVATLHDPITATPTGGNTFPTQPSPGGGVTETPTPSPSPTQTPSPTTTQSSSTATPSRTPTRTPTAQPTSPNPTAATTPQVQSTAVSNNPSPTTASQNTATDTPEPERDDPTPPPTEEPAPTEEVSPITTGSENGSSPQPQSIVQVPAEELQEASSSISAQ